MGNPLDRWTYRDLVPWRVLIFLDRWLPLCWADIVGWKHGCEVRSIGPPRPICFNFDKDTECWCGKFMRREDGKLFQMTRTQLAFKDPEV